MKALLRECGLPVKGRGQTMPSQAFPEAPAPDGRTVHLRLIGTTDLHQHLLPYDYHADRPMPGIGLCTAADLIDAARSEVRNALLFDNGDFLQGTPMGDHIAHDRGMRAGDPHPMIAAMNTLGYDAITLGNHEFNYGLDFLMKALGGAAFPVVSANLLRAGGEGTLVPPYALLDRVLLDEGGRAHPIRLGVIGLAPPQIVDWDRHILAGRLEALDMVAAARRWLPEMRGAGADLILALAHTGIGAAQHTEGMENAAIPLARLEGLDALMTGHSHLLFPSPGFAGLPGVDTNAGTIHGTPTVMGGASGAYIGLIDLALRREGGRWRVLGGRAHTRGMAPGLAAPAIGVSAGRVEEAVQGAHEATLAAIRRPVGVTEQPLHTFFAHLTGGAALALIADAQRGFVSARLADPGLKALPMLSAAAPFKAGGRMGPLGYTNVRAGPLLLRHIADLYTFPNAVAALRVTGAEVLEWLERSAAGFNRIAPGSRDMLLRNPEVPGYNFEVIDAIEVTYDLSRPARYDARGALIDWTARRVTRAIHQGKPLDPLAEFLLCTNSYRASGAGCFAGTVREKLVLGGGVLVHDLLRRHVARLGRVRLTPGRNLRFTAPPGTTAILETSPEAGGYLDEIADFAPVARGLSDAGFLRLRVALSGGE